MARSALTAQAPSFQRTNGRRKMKTAYLLSSTPRPALNNHSARHSSSGFTLIELITVVSVISILAAIAAPSFSKMIANQRTRAAATDINTALTKARSEAIQRNTNVTLMPNTANNWQSGWKIVNSADTTRKLDDHIAVNGITITGPADVTFQSSGRVRGNTIPSFNISSPNGSTQWCGTVELSGRPYLKASSC